MIVAPLVLEYARERPPAAEVRQRSANAIETRGLTRSFRGFKAVSGVDLDVRRGAIHALIGPNGAGKTTCFNLLTGFSVPSAGQVYLNGRDITGMPAFRVARLGMVRSFQVSATFPDLTLRENVLAALCRPTGSEYRFWDRGRSLARLDQRAVEMLALAGLADSSELKARELSYGRKRTLDFVTTLALEPDVLLLDEPSTSASCGCPSTGGGSSSAPSRPASRHGSLSSARGSVVISAPRPRIPRWAGPWALACRQW
jgi:ABC-type branched-subunit amino acid transport system ATPase component